MPTETPQSADGTTHWHVEGRTTIELRRNERGTWLATQRGVDANGRGETAIAAVAAYCRALDGNSGRRQTRQ